MGNTFIFNGIFLLIIAVIPLIFRNQLSYYVSIFTLAGINALVVIGLNMLMGYAGQISLGHAAFFAIGAYTTAILTTQYALTPALSFLPAVFLSGFIAFLVGLPTLKLREHYLAMATLGIGLICYAVLRADPFDVTGGPSGIPNIPPLHILGIVTNSDTTQHYFIWTAVFIIFIVSSNIMDSRFGRALMAIHKNESVASVLGVNAYKYKLKIFVLSAVYAGFAGYLYAHCSPLFYVNPDDVCNFMFSIKLVTMVVIGGMTTMWGALLGAVGLSLLPEILRSLGALFQGGNTSDIEMALYGIILVAAMVYSPTLKARHLLARLRS